MTNPNFPALPRALRAWLIEAAETHNLTLLTEYGRYATVPHDVDAPPADWPVTVILPFTSFGPYGSGTLLEKANGVVMEEELREYGLPTHWYSYGFYAYGLALSLDPEDWPYISTDNVEAGIEALSELLSSLAQYPVLDEDQWSELETEAISDAVDCWVLSDLRADLATAAYRAAIDSDLFPTAEDLDVTVTDYGDSWLRDGLLSHDPFDAGESWTNEAGEDMYIDTAALARAIVEQGVQSLAEQGILCVWPVAEHPPAPGPDDQSEEAFVARVAEFNRKAQAARWQELRA